MKNKDFSRSAFGDLDEFARIIPGNVIVVGGRPSMGKSSFLQDMAVEWASQGKKITYWDMQVSTEERMKMMLSSYSEVEMDKVISWWEYTDSENKDDFKLKTTGVEYQRIISQMNEMQQWTIEFPQDINIYDWLKDSEMPDVLIIDSIQMLMFSREMAIDIYILMNLLKRKAMETGMVVLIASQISRNVDLRQGHRPTLSDLSDSSSLEEVSDKVFFLLRREYYDVLDKPGQAELIIAKNRNGGIGTINLTFRKEIAQFANWAPVTFYGYEGASKENEDPFSAFTPA